MVVRKATDYWKALLAYLPRGLIWRQMYAVEGSYSDGVPQPFHWFSRMLMGIATTLSWFDEQIYEKLRQAWPTQASIEGIALWERVLWGAEQVAYWAMSLERRRRLVLGWLSLSGLGSVNHWREAAKKYGANVKIYLGPWRLFYTIESPAIGRWRAGHSAGRRLLSVNSAMQSEWDFITVAWFCRVAGCGIWWADGSN